MAKADYVRKYRKQKLYKDYNVGLHTSNPYVHNIGRVNTYKAKSPFTWSDYAVGYLAILPLFAFLVRKIGGCKNAERKRQHTKQLYKKYL